MQTVTEPSSATSADFAVNGMDCASCVAHVERAMKGVSGVRSANVSLARGRASVSFDPSQTTPEAIAAAATDAGYPSAPESPGVAAGNVEEERLQRQTREARAWFNRAIVGIVLWFPLEASHWILRAFGGGHQHHVPAQQSWMAWAAIVTSTLALVYLGGKFYRSAWAALLRRTTNMDTLIAMGASVAYAYSLTYFLGGLLGRWTPPLLDQLYFMESTGLLALVSLGHWLEARARQAAGSAIRELLNLAPATALRLVVATPASPRADVVQLNVPSRPTPDAPGDAGVATTEYEEVPVAELHPGDRVLVRPGDRVPIDGVVVDGRSSVDESMLTGESVPALREPGDTVIGGTVNADGRLVVRVTKTGGETALAQIVKLVEHAQSSKPPVQQLADKISAIFVPAVLSIALVTGIGWYAWAAAHGWDAGTTWAAIAKAVCSVLIIACPCALGLAVPAALMVGIGRGAKQGILIRDIDALQSAERIDTVVLDKTGTVTQGKPAVSGFFSRNGTSEDELLRLAASAEQYSEHPLGKAILARAREHGLKLSEPANFINEPGLGIVSMVEGRTLLIGNSVLLDRHAGQKVLHWQETDVLPGCSIVRVAVKHASGEVEELGAFGLVDPLKPDTASAIDDLKQIGLDIRVLSGDSPDVVERVAKELGLTGSDGGVRPGDKANVIRRLQDEKRVVAMVGDGVNDAPALAAADLGIAIGSGSDVAKETGGIVLVSGSLHGVATSIRLSRATMRKIRQNLFFAFVYNVLAIPLAAFGLLNPLIAAGAMALSDVTVIGNALLLRRSKID